MVYQVFQGIQHTREKIEKAKIMPLKSAYGKMTYFSSLAGSNEPDGIMVRFLNSVFTQEILIILKLIE